MIFSRTGRNDDTRFALTRLGERFRTSAFKSLSTGIEAGLEAPGSTLEDADAAFVNRELGQEPTFMQSVAEIVTAPFRDEVEGQGLPMSEEEYNGSLFFREGVKYREGMTVATARLLSEREDARNTRTFLLEQASDYVGKGSFFVGALLGSVVDVKNIAASIITAGTFTLGAGVISAIKGAKTVMNTAKNVREASLATRAARIGGEAIVATVPAVVSGLQNEPVLDTEYGVGDAFLDLGASAIFSVAITGGARGLKKTYDRFSSVSERADAAEIARAQFRANEIIDIDRVLEAQLVEKSIPFSTVKFGDKPKVRLKADGTAEARFDTEVGAMSGVVARGSNAEEAIAKLQRLYNEDIAEAAAQIEIEGGHLKLMRDIHELKRQKTEFDLDEAILDVADENNIDIREFKKAEAVLGKARTNLEIAEVSLNKRKASAHRQAKVANAKQTVIRAENSLGELRNSADMRLIVDQALARNKVLGDLINNKIEALKVVQRGQIQDKFSQFISEQTDPENAHLRSRDPALRAIDQDEVVAQAARAPEPQASDRAAPEVRQSIEERLQSETIDPGTKDIIERGLKDVDEARQRSQALRDWWNCRGGG